MTQRTARNLHTATLTTIHTFHLRSSIHFTCIMGDNKTCFFPCQANVELLCICSFAGHNIFPPPKGGGFSVFSWKCRKPRV